MYHPTRGGVRGGRDQFKWDDVKVDKHRENYLGHSIKAPVGRWQKGKDLIWYTRDNKSDKSDDALKEEIRRVKEEEDQAMREALGLAPKRAGPRASSARLDEHEYAELVKRGSTAEDLGAGHAEAAQVQGLGLYKPPRSQEESSSVQAQLPDVKSDGRDESPPPIRVEEKSSDEGEEERRKRRRRDEREKEKERRGEQYYDKSEERRRDKHESKHEKRKHRHGKERERRHRHDSD